MCPSDGNNTTLTGINARIKRRGQVLHNLTELRRQLRESHKLSGTVLSRSTQRRSSPSPTPATWDRSINGGTTVAGFNHIYGWTEQRLCSIPKMRRGNGEQGRPIPHLSLRPPRFLPGTAAASFVRLARAQLHAPRHYQRPGLLRPLPTEPTRLTAGTRRPPDDERGPEAATSGGVRAAPCGMAR